MSVSACCTANLSLPTNPQDIRHIGQMSLGCGSHVLANITEQHEGITLIVVPDFIAAHKLEQELKFFLKQPEHIKILQFPDWETLPYDGFSPHQDIISARLTTLHQLPTLTQGILIVPVTTLMHQLCPQSHVEQAFVISKGDTLQLEAMRDKLIHQGYLCVSQVMEHGEFAIRGAVLDIFPMGSEQPFRLELFDDEIESIRYFDPETQRSTHQISHINLLPAREFPMHKDAIGQFRSAWRTHFAGDPRNCPIYQDVSQGYCSAGLEYYLPLFFKQTALFFDYLPKNTLVLRFGDIFETATAFWTTIEQRHEQYAHDIERPILAPEHLFISPNALFAQFKPFPQIQCHTDVQPNRAGRSNLHIEPLPNLLVHSQAEHPLENLENFLSETDFTVVICAESAGRRVVLSELLNKYGIAPQIVDNLQESLSNKTTLSLMVAPLEKGGIMPAQNLVFITETELFGRPIIQTNRRKNSPMVEAEATIRNLTELEIGSPIVHLEHGVGRYMGLQKLDLSSQAGEFVVIHYANEDKLFVPVANLHLLSRYSSGQIDNAPLDSLGTDRWKKAKRKAAEQLKDTSAELLAIYAKRAAKNGTALPSPDEYYDLFSSKFPFEETPDQTTAIAAVIQDLTAQQPMDRVICGDVGFGKTEVAMRAAFLVAHAGKQVAVLVPTTLLAQQHYQNFQDRFADFPIHIEVASRFQSKQAQTETAKRLKAGHCDIIIGTHKLLQSDMQFQQLGLLIIDEEHRFGVKQKEKFKALQAQVDILTMTATPIPRTLNMAMQGIRDLSLITTPPAKRLSVKTFVREHNKVLIQEAITREIGRGGQIYFLHNSVKTIEKVAQDLSEWLPNARIAIAHGQQSERQLEQIMSDFYHHRYHVLVCTTIIETGIDIPTANTIIIDRADKLGLAQLHQLRGRVGRSHHQAYAYCLTPPRKSLPKDAQKRLDAIESLDTLGVGFTLATHDLEIRGAGELLGDEQSGNMQAIGFSLYMEILEKTVNLIKSGQTLPDDLFEHANFEIDLQIPTFIPEDYLPDVQTRLILYKRIATVDSQQALRELKIEIIDRFGPLPQATQHLLAVTAVKIYAMPLGIVTLKIGQNGGKVVFSENPNIDPGKLITLVQKNPSIYQFKGPNCLTVKQSLPKPTQRIEFIENLIQSIKN